MLDKKSAATIIIARIEVAYIDGTQHVRSPVSLCCKSRFPRNQLLAGLCRTSLQQKSSTVDNIPLSCRCLGYEVVRNQNPNWFISSTDSERGENREYNFIHTIDALQI